jgi:hypothetical protein
MLQPAFGRLPQWTTTTERVVEPASAFAGCSLLVAER